jgi:purine-nucleoside phosphorylase
LSLDPDISKRVGETVRAVRAAIDRPVTVGVVLGTGLGSFVARMRNVVSLPFASLPHMAEARTRDNEGNLCIGVIDDVAVACMQGEPHLYEGHSASQVVHGVRVMARLGARAVLLTDTCGALDPSLLTGTMMAVQDHLDLMALDSLASAATTFRPTTEVTSPYDAALTDELHDVAYTESLISSRVGNKTEIHLRNGVYGAVRDPAATTPAQAKMLRALGADVVGGSIVPGLVAHRHKGVRVAALAYVSYVASSSRDSIEEATGRFGLAQFELVVRGWVLRANRSL